MFGDTDGVPAPAGFISQLDSQALLTFDNLTVPGAYNDMDMLVRNCKPDHLLLRSAAADGLGGCGAGSLQRGAERRRVPKPVLHVLHPHLTSHSRK